MMISEELQQEIAAAGTAVANDPANAELRVALGIAHFQAEQYEAAMAAFRQAVDLEAESATAHNWVGRAHYHLGPAQAAIDAYERAITVDPHYLDPYFGLGIINFAQVGDFAAALAAFERGLAANPDDPYLTAFLGITYARMGDFDAALARLQEAIALEPKNAFAYSNVSLIYLHLKRDEEAIDACRREIAIEDNSEPHRLLGYLYDRQGQYQEAVSELERAVALRPEDYEARGALARLCRKVGRTAEARAHYAQASELAARDNEYGRACFAAVSGEFDQALALLAVALDQGQVQPGWARIDPEFTCLSDDPRFRALLEA